MLIFVPDPVREIRVALELDSVPDDAELIVVDIESGRGYLPINENRKRPEYLIDYEKDTGYIHLGFLTFEESFYSKIIVSEVN